MPWFPRRGSQLRVLLGAGVGCSSPEGHPLRVNMCHLWPGRLFLHLVCQLHPFLDWGPLQTVTHTLVALQLDYCNVLYVGLPLKTTQKLQLVQNASVCPC